MPAWPTPSGCDVNLKREDLSELHYITSIVNVGSILANGILSHNRSESIDHESVAMQVIQERRARARVPGGRPLHDYANLYIDARNPMMYKRQRRHRTLCVLRIDTAVLDLPEVVVTDCNAASDYVRYAPAPSGLAIVDKELAFAEWWTADDPIEQLRKRSARCAEVLVPDAVETQFILGAYVSCSEGADALSEATGSGLESEINRHLFFR